MKMIMAFLSLILISSYVTGKERSFTGSTPAGIIVKSFLGISLTDSVDFIRWQLILSEEHYKLSCSYGIGKPNTNGFINGGEKIVLKGVLHKEKHNYQLQNGSKTLQLIELNEDLLHLLDTDHNLLVGNGGWSYTLNNLRPTFTSEMNTTAAQTIFKDSLVFDGRTPCAVPGITATGMECYKLKWRIILYADGKNNTTGNYKILGTPYRTAGGRIGKWRMITGKNGRIIYQLNDEKGNVLLYLLKVDENILVFTDTDGQLLVGNEDFSYTLNRVMKKNYNNN